MGDETAGARGRAERGGGRGIASQGGLTVASAGRGEGAGRGRGQEAEKKMKILSHPLPGEKGPGCDRENDGRSHWSCWFERICLRNKLFVSQP